MNTKDFVVIPWGKPGNSVKLKYKKHAQELQMEKIQLELENQRMEETLREFQSIQNKGKEEIKSGGYHWKSGSVGKFGNKSHIKSQSKGNATKLPAGNVKLKLLKEQIEAPAKQLVNYKMAHSFGNEKPKVKKKVCGQCENKAALLAKSQILSNVLDVAHQFIKEANPPNEVITSTEASTKSQQKPKAPLLQEKISEVETTAAKGGEGTNPKYKPLCEMPFDEEASAKSFQEALTQWRAGQQEENKQQDIHATKPVFIFIDSVEECEVQTNLKIWSEPINIEFTEDSLSYMEKLWLKKHRRTPQEQLQSLLPSMTPHPSEGTMEEQWSQNESDADSDVEEIKVQYPPLFMPVEKVNIKRPPPSLTIVELDSSHEAELEEPGDAVPYRVQLANAESQVSSTFPDYQNCFPRENSIHQHLVFNKGKSDLLSLCLRTHSTYHKDELKASSNTDFGNTMESDIYSHEFKQVGETSSLKQNVTEKNKDPGNNQNSGDSSMPFWSKVSLPTADFDTYFLEENSSQDTSISLECSNPNERPNLEDSKITKSPLLLQDIALRKKPVNERYQGLEKFFTLHKNERLRSTPSPSLRGSHSCSRITFTEDKVWIPGSSLSEHAVSVVALCNLQSAGNSLPNMQQQKTGQKSQRPSTANFPVSSWAHKDSSCPLSSCPRSMSVAAAHSLSRAASEISEIEYIDVTDQNQPLLDNTADQQALDSLENELKVLRKLSGKCSSGRNTEMQSLLSLGDYSTDEEEEDFLERQHVITLPWTKNV
ncbi:Zbbx [Phodopus roborovskii]|uniref:Zbbx protein n=1 Tax=Phodopus roborovskii TaxID=109678 RepID=A0AAU9ZUZ6_PHORO|nr:Zbbx [Phodopus roborovskii]